MNHEEYDMTDGERLTWARAKAEEYMWQGLDPGEALEEVIHPQGKN